MNTADNIPSYNIESLKTTDTESKEFDFFRFEYFAEDIEHLKRPHRHHFYTFLLVTGGNGSHSIDFQSFPLIPRRLFLIAPNQVHVWEELGQVTGFVVLFNDSFLTNPKSQRAAPHLSVFQPDKYGVFDLSQDEMDIWIKLFREMECEVLRSDTHSRHILFHLVNLLLIRVSRLDSGTASPGRTTEPGILILFRELIEKDFATRQKPREYARELNITANYLNSLSVKTYNLSAGELIRQRILLEAKRLLAHTDLSISEIAFKLNFKDNSYFGRFFRRYTHMAPGSFRRNQRNAD